MNTQEKEVPIAVDKSFMKCVGVVLATVFIGSVILKYFKINDKSVYDAYQNMISSDSTNESFAFDNTLDDIKEDCFNGTFVGELKSKNVDLPDIVRNMQSSRNAAWNDMLEKFKEIAALYPADIKLTYDSIMKTTVDFYTSCVRDTENSEVFLRILKAMADFTKQFGKISDFNASEYLKYIGTINNILHSNGRCCQLMTDVDSKHYNDVCIVVKTPIKINLGFCYKKSNDNVFSKKYDNFKSYKTKDIEKDDIWEFLKNDDAVGNYLYPIQVLFYECGQGGTAFENFVTSQMIRSIPQMEFTQVEMDAAFDSFFLNKTLLKSILDDVPGEAGGGFEKKIRNVSGGSIDYNSYWVLIIVVVLLMLLFLYYNTCHIKYFDPNLMVQDNVHLNFKKNKL